MTKNKPALLAASLALALLVSLVLLWLENRQLHHQLVASRLRADEAARSAGEAQTRAKAEVEAEQALRRNQQNELSRLRAQLADLKRQATPPPPRPGQRTPPPAPTAPTAPPLESETAFTASLTNQIAMGETLLTGGWATKPGMRTFALLTPVVEAGDTAPTIVIQSSFIEGPEAFWESLGWGQLKADGKRSAIEGSLSAAHTEDLFNTGKETEGVNILSAPRVSTADGRAAQVFVGEQGPDGAPTSGLSLRVTPKVSADGQSVELIVNASLKPK